MNAVAKAASSEWVGNPFAISLPLPGLRLTFMLLLIFVTAFGVVYMKDLNRRLFINYQNLQQQDSTLNVNYGKLLLEEGTWASQARVQGLAKQLNMEIPTAKDVVMVKL